MYWIGFHAILFWFLFADFYKNAYRKKTIKSSLSNDEGLIKEKSQSLPMKNGYINGYSSGVNGYINSCSEKTACDNGYSHGSIANDIHFHSNGYQSQPQFGDSFKKID